MARSNETYPSAYNKWAGNPKGTAPDFERCCETVRSPERWAHFHQCTRKRGFGPGEAYCKQHVPEAVKARVDKSRAEGNARMNKERYRWHGRTFYNVLKQIAEGHNDARGLAQEVLAKFHEGEHK